jgi:hypothetical protein
VRSLSVGLRQVLQSAFAAHHPRRHLPASQQRALTLCGNFVLPFPYNEVTDETPPAGAAKHRVPGYDYKNKKETEAAESNQTRTL